MTINEKTKKLYSILAISLVIMLTIGNCPTFGSITRIGMRALGVFAGSIFCWFCGQIGWGSVLGMIMAALFIPENNFTTIFTTAFGSMNVMIMIWGSIFCYCLRKFEVIEYLSQFFLSKKWATKSPWHMLIILWIITVINSALVVVTMATVLISWNIYYNIAEKAGIKRKGKFNAFSMVSIAVFSSISIPLMPYSSGVWFPVNLMLLIDPTIEVNIIKICSTSWILAIAFFIIMAVIGKLMMKTTAWKKELDGISLDGLIETSEVKMSKKVKWGFFYTILLVIVMVIPSIFPNLTIINDYINRMTTFGAFVIVVLLMCLTTVDGERVISIESAAKEGVDWGMYFMFGLAMTVSGILVGESSGLVPTIQTAFTSIIGSSGNAFTVPLVVLGIGLIITNCINNAIAVQLVVPIICSILVGLGVNPAYIIGLGGVLLNYGNILPSGSPVGALLHGNSEWLTSKQVYLWASVGAIVTYLAFALIALPYACLIFEL